MKYYKLKSTALPKISMSDLGNCEFYEDEGVLCTENEYELDLISETEFNALKEKYIFKRSLKSPSEIEKLWDAVSYILSNQQIVE